jgi:putative ABC transport system permease protein
MRDFGPEIEAHIGERVDDLVERGMSPRAAREQAIREFGGTIRFAEQSAEAWGWTWIETVLRDARHGLRAMRRTPGFTAAALLSLTLGIGASCAIFSVLHALLLTPLPFRAPQDLVHVYQSHPRMPPGYKSGTSLPDLKDWTLQTSVFEGFTASQWTRHHVLAGDAPAYLVGLRVAANFFPLLGAAPMLGRAFDDEDFRTARSVVVLSHRFWARLGADPRAVGTTIRLDDRPYEVIGVMPPEFRYPPSEPPVPGFICELWEPLIPTQAEQSRRDYRSATVLGRIKPGRTAAQAQAELDALIAEQGRQYPNTNAGWTATIGLLDDEVKGSLRPALALLTAAVALVLLIACANVASLLLARSAARSHEIAIRVALGASRARLLTQSMVENLLLAGTGAALGLLVTHWALRALVPFFPHNVPRIEQIGIDCTVLFAAIAISVLTAALIALATSTSPRALRLTNGFVVLQIMFSLVLLVGAALMIRTLAALHNVDLGFQPDSVLTVRLSPPRSRYQSWEQVRQFHAQLLRDMQAQHGIESAALVMTLPLSGRSTKTKINADGSDREMFAERNVVSKDYFRVMRTPLWKGRNFADGDHPASEQVAIVNRGLARQLWSSDEAVGRRIRIGGAWRTVAGVVHDEKHWSLTQEAEPKFYIPYEQDETSKGLMSILTFLVVRTTNDPLQMVSPTRHAIWSVDRAMPADQVETMSQLVADSIAVPRFRTVLLGILAGMALLVAMIGVYGAMAFTVSRRTRDIGVSLALGARPGQILRAAVWDGTRLALTGIVLGLSVAAGLTRLLRTQLYGVEPLDAAAFGGAALVMLLVAIAACLIPARSAARVDPLVALRHD